MASVFRICAYACYKAYIITYAIYVHIKWIYGKLSDKLILIKASKNVSSLKNWELRLLYLIIFPASFGKLSFCYLKGIS